MSAFVTEVTITYDDLHDNDILVDKSGNVWNVYDVSKTDDPSNNMVSFYLGRGFKEHLVNKPAEEACKVRRPLTHEQEHQRLVDEFPEQGKGSETTPSEPMTITELKDAVKDRLRQDGLLAGDPETVEVLATDEDKVTEAALTGNAIDLPMFTDMTPLEQRSHLYVLHGVFAHDVQTPEQLQQMHNEAHEAWASKGIQSRYVAHTHVYTPPEKKS